MSPELREHITHAAQKIRADHHAELADIRKADGAVRLFRNMIHPSRFQKPSDVSSGEGMESLAADLGCLFGDAVVSKYFGCAVTLQYTQSVSRHRRSPNGNSVAG
jgi:hypothetical protein